jgi:RNA polymerase sigma-70 factor, ECF subfamily
LADDRELWDRICRGDERAFNALYRTLGPKMHLFLRRLLRNSQAAEDVIQETFAAVWQHPNGFAAERGTLRAYLFGAARKHAAAWWRKRGTPEEPVQSELHRSDTEMVSLLMDAVSRLPDEARALIWLREVEGYSYDELAQILDIPAGTVASRLFAAREKLRQVWCAEPEKKKGDS